MIKTKHCAIVQDVPLCHLATHLITNAAYIARGVKGFDDNLDCYPDTTNGFCVVCLERCMDDDYGQETYCVRCSEGHVYCPICADALGIGNKGRNGTWRCCVRSGAAPMSNVSALLTSPTIKVVHHVEDMAVSIDHLRANEAFIRERRDMDFCQYRHDSEFCVVCLRYRFTDTPGEYPCVYCECSNAYCIDCAKSCGMAINDEYCFAEGDCPLCLSDKNGGVAPQ